MDSQRTSKPKIPKNSLRTNFPVSSPSSKKDITAPAMGKSLNRSNLRKVNNVPLDILCPLCGAPHKYIYDNCGDHRQFKFKICWQTFPLLSSKVFTADVHFNQSNTASTSVSINTSVTTALTIKSNLKKLPMDPPPARNTGNTNFGIFTGSSPPTRIICGYGTEDGACQSVSLWVAYYNFLRNMRK